MLAREIVNQSYSRILFRPSHKVKSNVIKNYENIDGSVRIGLGYNANYSVDRTTNTVN